MSPQEIAERMHQMTHEAIDAAARETGGEFTADRVKELQLAMWREQLSVDELIDGMAFMKANEFMNERLDRQLNGAG